MGVGLHDQLNITHVTQQVGLHLKNRALYPLWVLRVTIEADAWYLSGKGAGGIHEQNLLRVSIFCYACNIVCYATLFVNSVNNPYHTSNNDQFRHSLLYVDIEKVR